MRFKRFCTYIGTMTWKKYELLNLIISELKETMPSTNKIQNKHNL